MTDSIDVGLRMCAGEFGPKTQETIKYGPRCPDKELGRLATFSGRPTYMVGRPKVDASGPPPLSRVDSSFDA